VDVRGKRAWCDMYSRELFESYSLESDVSCGTWKYWEDYICSSNGELIEFN
jgi:hypothetical protein